MKFPIYGKIKNGNETTNQLAIFQLVIFHGYFTRFTRGYPPELDANFKGRIRRWQRNVGPHRATVGW